MNIVSPSGYQECAMGGTLVVARADCVAAVCDAVRAAGTLHGWAARQPGARALQGRGTAWATVLPGGPEVVVRHSRHGGLLATITGDLFLAPTRAPRELENALRLEAAGVRTPAVVAYAVYRGAGPFCRADVATALVDGVDLVTALRQHARTDERHAIGVAVLRLLEALGAAGATHPDLNARNVLIAHPVAAQTAWVLDVDRVTFGRAPSVLPDADRNAVRLARSLAKLRDAGVIALTPDELIALSKPRAAGDDGAPRNASP